MKIASVLILILVIFFSCKFNYDDLANNIYAGDKLVVYACVDNESGCVVRVSHSLQPVGRTADSLEIAIGNAKIVLFENGDSIRTITQGVIKYEGYEYSDFTVNPKIGASYKIKVSAPGYSTVESEEEIFLKQPDVRDTSFVLGKGEIYGQKFFTFKGKLFFDSTQMHYYVITAQDRKDSCAINSTNYSGNIDVKYKTCDALLSNYPDFYGSSNCFFSGEELIWDITFNKYKNFITNCVSTSRSLKVSEVSKIYFDYKKSLNQPPPPQDLNFKEPNSSVTNIKNGYGYFYTKSTIVFTKYY